MMRLVTGAAGLGIVYVLTLASTDPVDLAVGVLLGALLIGLLGRRMRLTPVGHGLPVLSRILWFVVFVAVVLADVVRGAWDVALRVMHLRPIERPGVVRVPIGERSERGIAVSALASTLSPGSVLVDIDHAAGDLLLHVIDASDPDGVRDGLQRFYDRYQRRVFP
ncbi:MAG TPA: Na+/H+ antiporter subunit E [Solirubrobacteraceae bacterium]|nr:Na+/H+ antiporter subunit E [Solirubrobacteraceae bacterium]